LHAHVAIAQTRPRKSKLYNETMRPAKRPLQGLLVNDKSAMIAKRDERLSLAMAPRTTLSKTTALLYHTSRRTVKSDGNTTQGQHPAHKEVFDTAMHPQKERFYSHKDRPARAAVVGNINARRIFDVCCSLTFSAARLGPPWCH